MGYKNNWTVNSGWINEWSTNTNPDNSYNSIDFTNSLPSWELIKWIRWKKQSVLSGESGNIYIKLFVE